MLFTDVINLALSPFKSVAGVLGKRMRLPSAVSLVVRSRRTRTYTLPLLDYSELSSLYFAIDQATSDDKVRVAILTASRCCGRRDVVGAN